MGGTGIGFKEGLLSQSKEQGNGNYLLSLNRKINLSKRKVILKTDDDENLSLLLCN